jgi:hypothetical protein
MRLSSSLLSRPPLEYLMRKAARISRPWARFGMPCASIAAKRSYTMMSFAEFEREMHGEGGAAAQ